MTFRSEEYWNTSKRWRIEVTYAEVQSVEITDAGSYTPDRLYADNNGERQRTIKATIDPPESGVTVNFEVIDPDDPATDTNIDSSSAGNDNNSESFTLSTSSGSTNTVGTQIGATTNSSGEAFATLDVTNKIGGNNYIVRASLSGASMDSPEMRVWRKLRIEYDVMAETPSGTTDWGGNRKHVIHDNYLNGVARGLQAIFEDETVNFNRCTFITPVVASSPPEPPTPFEEFVSPHTTPDMATYHTNTQSRDGSPYFEKLHLISAHLHNGPANEDGVGGRAGGVPSDFSFVYWDKNQFNADQDGVDLDGGNADNLWIIAHEIGHNLGLWIQSESPCGRHHNNHGEDDVAGLSGHDCIMTQACEDDPALNVNGQFTKRFGPKCVNYARVQQLDFLE